MPDRNKKTVAGYLNAMPQRKRVKYVTMDMWTPYRDAARAVLPQATVIVDKFHVLGMANTPMEQIRKSLRSSLPIRQRRGLMHDRFILLKREHELTAQERFLLDNWRSLHPALDEAYRLKEQFFAVYDAPNRIEAVRRYQLWEASIRLPHRAAFAPIVTAWGIGTLTIAAWVNIYAARLGRTRFLYMGIPASRVMIPER